MKKTMKLLLISMLAISMFLVGCSSKTSNNANGKTDSGSSGAAKKDTLVFARGGDSTSLDPITTTEGETFQVTQNIFEGLLTYGPQDTIVHPGLAKSWDVSKDGLTYTFHLQQGVKFQDGTDFNADAVVFNFNRWENGNSDKFPYFTMFGGYKGDKGYIIKDIKAVDPNTVQFVLSRPLAPFLKDLAMSPFGIASPAAVKKYGDKFRENPVGTGPFKFVEWKHNDTITLEKNPNYWKQGLPKLNKLIYRVIPENTARLNALQNGEIDIMEGLNNSDEASVKSNSNLQVIERPSMNVGYIGLTVTHKPFDNKLVRQALNMAVDKKSIIAAFYGGKAIAAKNPMPPSIEGYNDSVQDYPYDLDKAKKLLAQAGFPNGFTMDLWAMPVARPYMPEAQKVAEVVQESFSKIGVKVNIKTEDWATYLDNAAKGKFDAYMLGWTGDNGDADNFLYNLLDKDSIGANNYSRYSNDKVHEILIKAQSEIDPAKRNELYKQAQVLIHDDAPWIPLVHSTPLMAAGKDVAGYLPHPSGSEALTNVYFK